MRRETLLKCYKIITFIEVAKKRRGFPPTQSEIAKKFKMSQPQARKYVLLLEKLGVIRRRLGIKKHVARGIKI